MIWDEPMLYAVGLDSTQVQTAKESVGVNNPNPTKGGMIYLEIDVERSGTIDWKLFNEGGQLIIEDSETITEHNAIFKTELLKGKKLSKGMYTLKIVTPNEVISKKVICY